MAEGLYDRGYLVNYNEGDQAIYRTPISYKASVTDEYYTINHNETLYDIARKKYGSSSLWYILADVNNIDDIFNLTPGMVILIPDYLIISSNYGQLE